MKKLIIISVVFVGCNNAPSENTIKLEKQLDSIHKVKVNLQDSLFKLELNDLKERVK